MPATVSPSRERRRFWLSAIQVHIEQLRLHQFRNYEQCTLDFPPGLVLLVGPNASGKTNLLEAIHVLCNGVSHRTLHDRDLCRWGNDAFAVAGDLRHGDRVHTCRITYESGKKQVMIDGVAVKRRTALWDVAATVMFSPEDLEIVKGAPALRRRLFDRLTAIRQRRHVHDVLAFRQVLQQRNQLLREIAQRRQSRNLADLFDEQYCRYAALIIRRRLATLAEIEPRVNAHLKRLSSGKETLRMQYLSGEQVLDAAITHDPEAMQAWCLKRLQSQQDEEIRRGRSLWGPQRDDVRMLLNDRDTRHFASQGQQRSLVLALRYAELELLQTSQHMQPVLLLDDVLSELDATRIDVLLATAAEQEQAFITATEAAAGRLIAERRVAALFRIENGRVEARTP